MGVIKETYYSRTSDLAFIVSNPLLIYKNHFSCTPNCMALDMLHIIIA